MPVDHVTEMLNEFLGKNCFELWYFSLERYHTLIDAKMIFFLEFHIDGENIPRGFRFFRFLLSFCYSILIFLFFTWVIENEMEFKRLNTIARFTEVSVYINSWFILIWSSKINILWIREIKFMHIHLDCLKY